MDAAGSRRGGVTPPEDLLRGIATALSGLPVLHPAPDDLPPAPGAYLLVIRLAADLAPDLPRFQGRVLSAGWYLYAGSAYGPGGIQARVARHMRRDKARRWHVDHLTVPARAVLAAGLPDETECKIASELARLGGFTVPLTGFGSSDCRTCEAHLLAFGQ